jgi:hypothetical protein
MQRLRLSDEPDSPRLAQLPPTPPPTTCELIACLSSATAHCGVHASYSGLLCASGAAFMLCVSPSGFRREDAIAGRWRLLPSALIEAGFDSAQIVEDPPDPLALAASELSESRAVPVLGCFPEAPWRAGLAVGILDAKGLWAILDASGRVHSLAARASLAITLGPTSAPSRPSLYALLRRCLWSWEGVEANEGPAAWTAWLKLLGNSALADPTALAAEVSAHDFLYETLLDARTHAATWLDDRADEADGNTADWLASAADTLREMTALLESRDPALHQPNVAASFADSTWRAYLADLLGQAAELDLQARHALACALDADYPPA